jgi:hypothetical protein
MGRTLKTTEHKPLIFWRWILKIDENLILLMTWFQFITLLPSSHVKGTLS